MGVRRGVGLGGEGEEGEEGGEGGEGERNTFKCISRQEIKDSF